MLKHASTYTLCIHKIQTVRLCNLKSLPFCHSLPIFITMNSLAHENGKDDLIILVPQLLKPDSNERFYI